MGARRRPGPGSESWERGARLVLTSGDATLTADSSGFHGATAVYSGRRLTVPAGAVLGGTVNDQGTLAGDGTIGHEDPALASTHLDQACVG
jgi:hypothetical protein